MQLRKTMRSIRQALTERWYTWENARVAAMEDEEINLYADPEKGEQAYRPGGDQRQDEGDLVVTDQSQSDELSMPPPPDHSRAGGEARI